MAKWTKAEEGYFADSFNRDSVYACADSTKTIALNNWTCDGLEGVAALAKGEYCLTSSNTDLVIGKTDIHSFTDPIRELQEKVEVLELAIKQQQTKVLRHYKRSDFLTLGG